jgi:hypothetical protein
MLVVEFGKGLWRGTRREHRAQPENEEQKTDRGHCDAPDARAEAACGALKPKGRRGAVR